jgi:hypothetical protein
MAREIHLIKTCQNGLNRLRARNESSRGLMMTAFKIENIQFRQVQWTMCIRASMEWCLGGTDTLEEPVDHDPTP